MFLKSTKTFGVFQEEWLCFFKRLIKDSGPTSYVWFPGTEKDKNCGTHTGQMPEATQPLHSWYCSLSFGLGPSGTSETGIVCGTIIFSSSRWLWHYFLQDGGHNHPQNSLCSSAGALPCMAEKGADLSASMLPCLPPPWKISHTCKNRRKRTMNPL